MNQATAVKPVEQTQVVAPPRQGLIQKFAARFGVDPGKFADTIKATCFYSKDGVSNEQLMALLVVADQYGLNPFTKELYAFPDPQRGGIVPIVSVDGWNRILNEQKTYAGATFNYGPASEVTSHKGAPQWIEVTIHRSDREHQTTIREYMSECWRDTGPWKSHPQRMLRHKSLIQAARVAFGFAGIYDEDEGRRIIDGGDAVRVTEAPAAIADINAAVSGKRRGPATLDGEVTRDQAPHEEQAPAKTGGPEFTFAQVAAALNEAKTREAFDLARDMIRSVPDERQRAELEIEALAKAKTVPQ